MAKIILFSLLFFFNSYSYGNDIEFTVHHGPGGPSDKVTRVLASDMSKRYQVVNRPGAQGRIAVRHLLNSNSIMVATVAQIFVTNFIDSDQTFYKKDDLEIISVVGIMPNILVCNNKLGFKTFKDFLSTEKSLSFGVAGYGSAEHLATEILFRQFKNNHIVIPYAQGGVVSLNDLLSGHIDCMFANYPLVKEHVSDGTKITALISSHDLQLSLPTWQREFKTEFPFQSYLAVVIDKKISPEIKKEIALDLEKVYNMKSKNDLNKIGLIPILSNTKKAINDVHNSNKSLREFVEKNKIRLN